jgi:hypothetical protein
MAFIELHSTPGYDFQLKRQVDVIDTTYTLSFDEANLLTERIAAGATANIPPYIELYARLSANIEPQSLPTVITLSSPGEDFLNAYFIANAAEAGIIFTKPDLPDLKL